MEGGFEFEVLGTDLRHQEGGMNRQKDVYIEFYPCVLKDISPLEPLPNKVVGDKGQILEAQVYCINPPH